MKQKLNIMALMAIVMTLLFSQTAKAEDVMYTIFNSATSTMTFYYGDKSIVVTGENETVYEVPTTENTSPGWRSDHPELIKTVVFHSSFNDARPTSCYYWFSGCSNLTTITGIEYLHTDNVTNMSYMFSNCSKLTSLDLSNFNTAEVKTMRSMFNGCSKLNSLDLSNFNTAEVTDMYFMFGNCTGLTSLNLSSFTTAKVTTMDGLFNGCSSLESLNLSNFDTTNVMTMSGMFEGCSKLKSLDLSNFNTAAVKDMNRMFSGCSALEELDLSNFKTDNVKYMGSMFANCTGLTSLNLSNFNTANVMSMGFMFGTCTGLTSLNLSSFTTAKVTNMAGLFYVCSSLISLDLSNFNTAEVTDMHSMFYGCSGLNTIYVSDNFVTDQVTSSDKMFYYCQNLDGAIPYNSSNVKDKTYANYNTGYFKTYCKVGETLYDMCGEELKVDDLALIDGKDFVAHAPFTATNVAYNRTISPNAPKWDSLCLPFEYTPSDFEAYRLTSSDDANNTITLEKIEGSIAAGTPVLFKKPEDGASLNISAANANIVALPVEGTTTETGNLKLVGTYQAKTFTSEDNNCFILKDDKLMNPARLLLTNTNVTKVGLNAYRAYMVNETSSSTDPQTYSIETGEGTTVINSLNIMTGEGAEYYDMTGCRTNGLKKGLNIVRQGGKTMKIIIK